ncbi:MAG: hypothetical protein LBN29_00715 [Mediterranea sp.]|jgi:hypothetical protein|nr:hypothetical protein [Mediterranea sp.]
MVIGALTGDQQTIGAGDTAEVMGISPEGVSKRKQRLIKRIRKVDTDAPFDNSTNFSLWMMGL